MIFAPQIQLDLQSGWSEYKDLSLGFAACLSKNPINEIPIFNICSRKKSLQKLYIYLIELQILILHAAGFLLRQAAKPSGKIPAEPRRVLKNSMGVLKITP